SEPGLKRFSERLGELGPADGWGRARGRRGVAVARDGCGRHRRADAPFRCRPNCRGRCKLSRVCRRRGSCLRACRVRHVRCQGGSAGDGNTNGERDGDRAPFPSLHDCVAPLMTSLEKSPSVSVCARARERLRQARIAWALTRKHSVLARRFYWGAYAGYVWPREARRARFFEEKNTWEDRSMRKRDAGRLASIFALVGVLFVLVASCGGAGGDVSGGLDASTFDAFNPGSFSQDASGGTGGGSCTPAACASLGYSCGVNADGCGGTI